MICHFTTHFENVKAKVREMKPKNLPYIATNEVAQAVEDRRADFKGVIDVFLRAPVLM